MQPKPDIAAQLGELQMAMHGLSGIFWALDLLVTQQVADNIIDEHSRRNGISSLITAGEVLTEKITEEF